MEDLKKMATTRRTIEDKRKRAAIKKKLDKSKEERSRAYKNKPDDMSFMDKANKNRKEEDQKRKDIKKVRKKAAVIEGSGKVSTLARNLQDAIKGIMPAAISLDTSREMDKKVSGIGNRTKRRKRDKGFNFTEFTKDVNKKKASKKRGGGIVGRGMGVALKGGGGVTRG